MKDTLTNRGISGAAHDMQLFADDNEGSLRRSGHRRFSVASHLPEVAEGLQKSRGCMSTAQPPGLPGDFCAS
jgi:hypothetical protein